LDLYLTNNHAEQQKNLGRIEALNRLGYGIAAQTFGPMRQAQLQAAQQANQRYNVQVGDQTIRQPRGKLSRADLNNNGLI